MATYEIAVSALTFQPSRRIPVDERKHSLLPTYTCHVNTDNVSYLHVIISTISKQFVDTLRYLPHVSWVVIGYKSAQRYRRNDVVTADVNVQE